MTIKGNAVAGIFEGIEDRLEAMQPGYKAQREVERIAAAERREIELRRVVRHYGSERAVFDEHQRERSLREALEPLADRKPIGGSDREYVVGFGGWTTRNPPPAVWEALRAAYRVPDTLHEVWEEFRWWGDIADDREVVTPGYEMPVHVRARIAALEHLLDTLPDPSVKGIRARLAWLAHVAQMDFSRDAQEDQALAKQLRADFEEIAVHFGQPRRPAQKAATAHRSTADKRRDVLALLRAEPGLADREIARRCGVSPQTASNWRRRG